MNKKFIKQNAVNEAKFFFKKYNDETIWTQALLEGENIEFTSVQTFLDPLVSIKTPLNMIFGKQEHYSQYTIELLRSLKHAWLDVEEKWSDISKESLSINELLHINHVVSACDGNNGGIRQKQVKITGTQYLPQCQIDIHEVEKDFNNIYNSQTSDLNKAIDLFLYGCKTQIFYDGNKRTSLINATFYLITHGIASQFYIPKEHLKDFVNHLIKYYENKDYKETIKDFIKTHCLTYTEEFKQTKEYQAIIKKGIK